MMNNQRKKAPFLLTASFYLFTATSFFFSNPIWAKTSELPQSYKSESKEQRDMRMEWWREARFGMFIHWGLYSVLEGEWNGKTIKHAEWIMRLAGIPVAEYEPLCEQFNPVKFDADEWVRLAKATGMKYLVITSKHHDGFCLWDSKVSDYDVVERTPFKRDILKELAEACRKQGLVFGIYYSILDWHHPDYLPAQKWETRSSEGADYQRYIAYMKTQLKELITQYDPAILWFDGEWDETWTHEEGVKLYGYLRSLKPDIIINNRVDKGREGKKGLNRAGNFVGDFGTPEQEVPPQGLPGVDWESCMTMNDNWGYSITDKNFKSAQNIIQKLVNITSKGGNYLLNIGPKPDGTFPAESIERLAEIGRWMKVNGDSIYATKASPFTELNWGRCTQKPVDCDTLLYLHIFKTPPDGKLTVSGLKNEVLQTTLLGVQQPLMVTRSDSGIIIQLPVTLPDPIDTVIVLKIKGQPQIETADNFDELLTQ